jgi:transcriptional repressor NrdR
VSVEKLEKLVNTVGYFLEKGFKKEVKSKVIGELVMKKLHALDEIAYVRFASVYRQFRDVSEFMKELKHLLK